MWCFTWLCYRNSFNYNSGSQWFASYQSHARNLSVFKSLFVSLFTLFLKALIYTICFAFFNKCCVHKCWGRWITRFRPDACSQSLFSKHSTWEQHPLRSKATSASIPLRQEFKIYSRNLHSPPGVGSPNQPQHYSNLHFQSFMLSFLQLYFLLLTLRDLW